MSSDAIVELADLTAIGAELSQNGNTETMERLEKLEPALFGYLNHEIMSLSGRLVLNGAPTPLVQQTADEALRLFLTCLGAMQLGQFRLWRQTLPDTPMAKLDHLLAGQKLAKSEADPPSGNPSLPPEEK